MALSTTFGITPRAGDRQLGGLTGEERFWFPERPGGQHADSTYYLDSNGNPSTMGPDDKLVVWPTCGPRRTGRNQGSAGNLSLVLIILNLVDAQRGAIRELGNDFSSVPPIASTRLRQGAQQYMSAPAFELRKPQDCWIPSFFSQLDLKSQRWAFLSSMSDNSSAINSSVRIRTASRRRPRGNFASSSPLR